MDFPTIIATATAVAWVARNQDRFPIAARLQRTSLRDCAVACNLFLYNHIYLPYRSEISILVGFLLRREAFDCDCCCLQLGGQDLDSEYHESCTCDVNSEDNDKLRYCRTCISTYLETQVAEHQSAKPVCMTSQRLCELDDRLVRKRLSPATIEILDRNQIMLAVRTCSIALKKNSHEKLWHCPSPDCAYVGFISNRKSRNPPTVYSSLTRLFRSKSRCDPRSIQCPACLISSCQFCNTVWTKGTANHEGITCEKYATQLTSDSEALRKWKSNARVQVCRSAHCNYIIEKNEGCNHITCRCGYEFCWVCGDEWSNQHSYFCRRQRRDGNQTGGTAVERIATWFGSWF